jgi:hypothetical protein
VRSILNNRHRAFCAGFLAFFLFLGVGRSAQELPIHLTDQEFWKLVTDFSEKGGSFLSDNFVSNERSFQRSLTELKRDRETAGAYLGVGPEQNFTYIVALQPRIAFIFDIRRQNLIQHLMYKALFELSPDRAEFISRLFSRARPENLSATASIEDLFVAFGDVSPETELFHANLQAIKDHLIKDHGFTLTADDEASLEYVFSAFFIGGPTLAYSRTFPPGIMPSFQELMTEVDERGVHRGFLATQETYQTMRQFEMNNLLVPLVGDFAGPTAIRSVGDYLKERGTPVTAFYVSNVEQYLFRDQEGWKNFYSNVATLPLRPASVFIRALIKTRTGQFSPLPVVRPGYSYLEISLSPISDLITAFNSDVIHDYSDILLNQVVPEQ